ncbi:preprotein translocase subunit YajC [Brevibacillus laterosporus]|uniref:Preprotein translocase subunit YajC n=2 Tax=Brevibacillus TaxID=55080 RepID=A0A0F7C0J8_BRELA|nr:MULTISPECIES: preprotein translocase subunit YajC [Brevibacillus]AKF94970.1 preprotein translocase subunit YajC [Brevibacillus laterosporus]MCR8986407.1 preprotein translocase subunit YajC [Brevibacillus laterosporus]MCZ0832142.1 preprotein translocase subunit YajC [Brevibacillus halotolerans]MDN9010804.1 preprotein translocase subunit YajC [Brevibacillus laterosporus]MDO0941827.1 preprotein translocase subunit YajC [Brevibacillus laterosporus]
MQGLGGLLPIIIMFVIFYFLLIRPQQKRNKERNAMLAAMKKGDRVVTIGGLHGTIQDITDDTLILKVSHNVHMTFDRGAVNSVTVPSPTKEVAETKKEELEAPAEDTK